MVHSLATENSSFAVCHIHTAKPKNHSAKDWPSVTLGKQHTAWSVKVDEAANGAFLWKNTTLIRQESDWTVKSEIFHG